MILALLLLAPPAPCPATFTDVARQAGLAFTHERGATPEHHLPETMGSGIAWLDYDNDGWMDLYVVQSGPFPPAGKSAQDRSRTSMSAQDQSRTNMSAQDKLFHNNGDGTFTDVTAKAKLHDNAYGMGAIAADYDNDGFTDLFVTNYGRNILYHNNGDGTFTDVTDRAGVGGSGWSTSAAWADIDGDGYLDLYVARYVDDSHEKDYFCGDVETGERAYCAPMLYPGTVGILYHNNGDGTFTDITKSAGVALTGKGLGVLFFDYDGDGKPDLYVANDEMLNFLFHNLGGNRFEDVSVISGTAFDASGAPQGSMGVDAGDLTGSGLPDLAVANFDYEINSLYRNLGSGLFEDASVSSGFASPERNHVGFGLNFLDVDGDGALDAFIANGHIMEKPRRQGVTYAEKNFLLWNDGRGKFHEQGCGPAFEKAYVGRGSAVADYDNDGDPDIAVSNSGGPLQLLRNDGPKVAWVGVQLEGRRSNREGVGAKLVAELPSGRRLTRWVEAGSSYLSSSDPRVLFRLGKEASVKKLTITWPSGIVQVVANPPVGKYTKIVEAAAK